MRNLLVYPVTDEEVLKWAKDWRKSMSEVPASEKSIGDMRPLYLDRITQVFEHMIELRSKEN